MALIDNISTSSYLEAKERILVDVRYYDDNNALIRPSDLATRIDITIYNSVFLRATTEDYLDPAPYGEGKRFEIEENGEPQSNDDIVYSTAIEKEHYSSLSEVLLQKLKTKIKSISLRLENESDIIEINEEVMSHILYNFDTIYLNLSGLIKWITIPDINTEVKYLRIENANIIIKQAVISCETEFILRNCVIKSFNNSNNSSLLVTIGSTATLVETKIASKIRIGISGIEAKDIKKWKDTCITISSFSIGFEDTSKNDKTNSGFYDAILSLADVATVRVSELTSYHDIPAYPLLSVRNVNEANISDISRASRDFPALAPAIQAGDYYRFSLSGAKYIGVGESYENSAFIRFIRTKLNSSISVSNITLYNMALFNLTGISCQKINIHNAVLQNKELFYNMNSSFIGKLILSNVKITSNSLSLKADSLSVISESTLEIEDNCLFTILEAGIISDGIIRSKNSFNLVLGNEASTHFEKTSLISIKEIKVTTQKEENEAILSRLAFDSSYLSSALFSFSSLNSLRYEKTDLYGRELKINLCKTLILGLSIHYNEAPLPITISNTSFQRSIMEIYKPGSKQNISLSNCIGEFVISYLDDTNDNSVCKINLKNAPVIIHFGAVGKRKVSVKSEASLGAAVTGQTDDISVIPEIESIDRVHFTRVTTVGKDTSKILYGTFKRY
jgi:hypothetical protein